MEVNQGGLGGQVGLGGQGHDETIAPSAASTSTSVPSGPAASTLHEPPARADIKDARSELSNAIEATR
jgi:hypothetical protein